VGLEASIDPTMLKPTMIGRLVHSVRERARWRLNLVQVCCICHKLLLEGQKVTVNVTSTYHVLKSKVAYALDQRDLEADPDTLAHKECPGE
jgi:hypothetical protein